MFLSCFVFLKRPLLSIYLLDVWIGLNGCLEAFDKIAQDLSNGAIDIDAALQQATAEQAKVTAESDKKSAEIYVRVF